MSQDYVPPLTGKRQQCLSVPISKSFVYCSGATEAPSSSLTTAWSHLTSSVGINLICTFIRCPGDSDPCPGMISKWFGFDLFSLRYFRRRCIGKCLSICLKTGKQDATPTEARTEKCTDPSYVKMIAIFIFLELWFRVDKKCPPTGFRIQDGRKGMKKPDNFIFGNKAPRKHLLPDRACCSS